METINYHGFIIMPDKLLGFSMYDRQGGWCCSCLSIEKAKEIADGIIATD